MAENNYAEGTLEWHAYGHGFNHGLCWITQRDTPLDGEWAGSPTTHDVIRTAWQRIMGDDWDTFDDGDPDDRDSDEAILDAWEAGYFASFGPDAPR